MQLRQIKFLEIELHFNWFRQSPACERKSNLHLADFVSENYRKMAQIRMKQSNEIPDIQLFSGNFDSRRCVRF